MMQLKYCYVFLLKTKDEAFKYFKTYKAKVENQLEKKIKRVRFYCGGEYFLMSSIFSVWRME